MDFICARRSGALGHEITGYNSRRGVGPIETYIGWGLDLGHREVMHTQAIHFDSGFERNGFAWVTNIWEAQLVHEFGKELICSALERWVSDTKRRWPETHFVSFGEFGAIWRNQHRTNQDWNYRFTERGCGLGDSYNNLEIEWYMNPRLRLARLRDWHMQTPWKVIDFTRYDLPAREPADPDPQHPIRNWSLLNNINQKGLRQQDRPTLFTELSQENQEFIHHALPEFRE
jgi:hypothetical protein